MEQYWKMVLHKHHCGKNNFLVILALRENSTNSNIVFINEKKTNKHILKNIIYFKKYFLSSHICLERKQKNMQNPLSCNIGENLFSLFSSSHYSFFYSDLRNIMGCVICKPIICVRVSFTHKGTWKAWKAVSPHDLPLPFIDFSYLSGSALIFDITKLCCVQSCKL